MVCSAGPTASHHSQHGKMFRFIDSFQLGTRSHVEAEWLSALVEETHELVMGVSPFPPNPKDGDDFPTSPTTPRRHAEMAIGAPIRGHLSTCRFRFSIGRRIHGPRRSALLFYICGKKPGLTCGETGELLLKPRVFSDARGCWLAKVPCLFGS